MATIYRKINQHVYQPSGYDNTLILGQHESILYPFDFGDYNEIRMGVAWTITTWDDDNKSIGIANGTEGSFESTYTTSHIRQSFYAGFNNSSLSLPYSSGNTFLGIGITTGIASYNYLHTISPGGSTPMWGITCSSQSDIIVANNSYLGTVHLLKAHNTYGLSGGKLSQSVTQIPTFNFPVTNSAEQYGALTGINSGSSILNYGFFSMRLAFSTNDQGKTIYSLGLTSNRNLFSPADVRLMDHTSNRNLKFFNSYPTLLGHGPIQTGYWTDNFVSGGTNLAKPTAFFLFNPFANHRLRLHNLIAEKYA